MGETETDLGGRARPVIPVIIMRKSGGFGHSRSRRQRGGRHCCVRERERDKRVTEKNLANVISNNYFLEREKREERESVRVFWGVRLSCKGEVAPSPPPTVFVSMKPKRMRVSECVRDGALGYHCTTLLFFCHVYY